jgi:phage baseplate assembly protein W
MLFKTSIKYPITFNLTTGSTDLDDLTTSINRCIALILTTGKGELLGDPEFGCRLYEILFNQFSENLETVIKKEILDSLNKFESRITLYENDITITHVDEGDRNEYKITLSYMITGTNRVAETEVYLQEDISRYGK